MDFKTVVARRRMVRNYTDEPVEREAIERIVQAAKRAPSAGYTQGQYFVVVTDPSIRQEIAALSNEAEYVKEGFDPWISSAPVHVVVCVNEADYHRRYREPDKLEDGREIEWPVPYWWVDGGAALMLLLLAAVDEGLAAGFFGFHRMSGLNELLQIPPEISPLGVVTIGHPAPDRRSGSLHNRRKPLERIAHWEQWTEAAGLKGDAR
jgi:FMN reductase [NAD(P)H]